MATKADIEAAINEIRADADSNIAHIADKHGIERTRLSKLNSGTIGLKEDYDDRRGLLSKPQDLKLLELVNRLTREGIPPTPKIVSQFCRDLCGKLPGKNWPRQWVMRHQGELDSGVLKGFDLDRKKADSFWQYRAYFELVLPHPDRKACTNSRS